jgi:hypothetical protein
MSHRRRTRFRSQEYDDVRAVVGLGLIHRREHFGR